MKLAEALINRADAQKRIHQLRERLTRNVKIQEGETPSEDPQELLAELRRTIDEFTRLVKQINRTNSVTVFGGGLTLTDALAERDGLALERNTLSELAQAAGEKDFRYGRSEIKLISTFNVGELQKRIDDLARRYRELDTAIQQANWNIDLIEN